MTDAALPAPDGSTDPHQWLEDVTGEDALAWVRERNARAEQELDGVPDPPSADGASLSGVLQEEIRQILDAADRIPAVTKRGDLLYNVWTDAEHPRGLWRRTTLESYRTEAPEWEVLLDLDALGADEGENWVWHGASLLRPAEGEPYRRALVNLSRGGSDADVTREFDLETKQFVTPLGEGGDGFSRPESKGSVTWLDADTVLVATDFGEGTMSSSGYPRQVRIWRRGQQLADAELVFEADENDMSVFVGHESTPGYERDWIIQMHAFYNASFHLLDRTQSPPTVITIDVPRDLEVNAHRDLAVFTPRSDWTVGERTFPGGSFVVGDFDAYLRGETDSLNCLFEPTPNSSLEDATLTRNTVVLTILEDVVHRLEVHTRQADGTWRGRDLFPDLEGSLAVAAVDGDETDELWLTVTSFIEPTRLLLADLAPCVGGTDGTEEDGTDGAVAQGGPDRAAAAGTDPAAPEVIKSAPARFDADGLQVTQHFATSDDGTRIPYFEIGRTDRPQGEPSPTLLYGYGGFEISLTPAYLGVVGKAWVERGGTYVLANIRGGGEYGPRWHQAALKKNRHRAYEDFSSVGRDLISRGVTDAQHLAVRGGSNGGLLTGNMLTQYPDLFGAVIIQVPLLDMKRYSHLLAGYSWMAEYGDPDTADWEYIRTFSPYHLLREGVQYPPAFVLTSTRDDRVHPGHARKFTAALESLGANVRSWENIEGGHGGAATNEQAARMNALMYTFLWNTIGSERPAS